MSEPSTSSCECCYILSKYTLSGLGSHQLPAAVGVAFISKKNHVLVLLMNTKAITAVRESIRRIYVEEAKAESALYPIFNKEGKRHRRRKEGRKEEKKDTHTPPSHQVGNNFANEEETRCLPQLFWWWLACLVTDSFPRQGVLHNQSNWIPLKCAPNSDEGHVWLPYQT